MLSAREDIGNLYTVWHVDPAGRPGEWSHPQHRRLTVAEDLIVLDSSHRLVAAYPAEAELRVLMIVLGGPFSSLVPPGLARFEDAQPPRD